MIDPDFRLLIYLILLFSGQNEMKTFLGNENISVRHAWNVNYSNVYGKFGSYKEECNFNTFKATFHSENNQSRVDKYFSFSFNRTK